MLDVANADRETLAPAIRSTVKLPFQKPPIAVGLQDRYSNAVTFDAIPLRQLDAIASDRTK